MPLITIGLTHYDRPEMLRKSLKFIQNQTFRDFQVIIGNDNPDIKIDKNFLQIENENNILILNNIENLGETQNMNNILQVSNTEWFMWLADDDLLHPQCLEILFKNFELIKDNKNVVALYPKYFIAKKYSNHFNKKLYIYPEQLILDHENFIDWYIKNQKKIIGCYGLMKTKTLKKINGFPELGKPFSPYSDDLLPLLLSSFGKICLIDQKLFLLQTHEKSLSVKSIDIDAYTSAQFEYLKIFQQMAVNAKLKINKNSLYIFCLNKRFLSDNFYVLFRNSKISLFNKFLFYLKIQRKFKFKLRFNHIILYYFFMFFIPLRIIITRLVRIIFKSN